VVYGSTSGADVYHDGVLLAFLLLNFCVVVECQWVIINKRGGGQIDRFDVSLIIGVRVWT
jgi:hypothetical protein